MPGKVMEEPGITLVVIRGSIKAHGPKCEAVEEARSEGRLLIHMRAPKIPRDMPKCSCLELAQ
jgi:hypothetical protein